jgi:hypothetical protein
MIEIRELIIRANIESSAGNSRSDNSAETSGSQNTGCCEENIEQMIKLFKEKNER